MKFAHKAVAIPYLIALVIGLVVVAIIVYWIFRTTSSPTLSLQQCKSRYMTWCSNCAQMNWPHFHCMPYAVLECKEILREAGFNVPTGDCDGYSRCDEDKVKEDCAALGVCLNNPKCAA